VTRVRRSAWTRGWPCHGDDIASAAKAASSASMAGDIAIGANVVVMHGPIGSSIAMGGIRENNKSQGIGRQSALRLHRFELMEVASAA